MGLRRVGAGLVLLLAAAQVASCVIAVVGRGEPRSFTAVHLDDFDEGGVQEVVFPNAEQGIDLAGLIFRPSGEGPFPGAVIIHGSGTSQRENGWYLTLVHHLQGRGVAVLLPDKRGSEESEGEWRTASFDDLATDAAAAVEYLSKQSDVASSRIGVIGMSQGGHIAPLVAARSTEIDFVVNVVGAAVPMHELLVYEETHNLRQFGVLPGLANVMAIGTSYALRKGSKRRFWDKVGNFDALPHWRALSVPALVLYGELDTNVPSAKSAELLRSLGKSNIDVRVFEGSGHALEDPPGRGTSILREDALVAISDFIVTPSPGR